MAFWRSAAFARAALRQGVGAASRGSLVAGTAGGLAACGYLGGWGGVSQAEAKEDDATDLVNWSGTHTCSTGTFLQPQSIEELEAMIGGAHERGSKLRVVGSALSPNGLAFSSDGMISMALCDSIVEVDAARKRITVEAGATVAQVIEALRPHGLTLQNLASINEQQLGGFIQVSAHGTGATIPPVDSQVVGLDLVTPAEGLLHVSASENADLFEMAKVGLGALGVVARVTLQCVDAHLLEETTFTQTVAETQCNHANLLRSHRHVRYMWMPYTDTVVVVTCDPVPAESSAQPSPPGTDNPVALEPLRRLLASVDPAAGGADGLNFAALRDRIIAHDPLSVDHIVRLNTAEAEFWKRSGGKRIAKSEECLAFECGGSQCVWEVCFPCGTLDQPSMSDVAYVPQLMERIQQHRIPAPAPIEQRWSARSTAPMSPASSGRPDTLFSWVGIIMYLPLDDDAQRKRIMSRFNDYCVLQRQQLPAVDGHSHWAKLEPPSDPDQLAGLQRDLATRFPAHDFNKLRRRLDPRNILANRFIDACFPLS